MRKFPQMNAAFASAAREFSKQHGIPLQQAMIEVARRDPKAYARVTDDDMSIERINADADDAAYESLKAKCLDKLIEAGFCEASAKALIARFYVAPQTLTDDERAALDAIKIGNTGVTNRQGPAGEGAGHKPAQPSPKAPVAGVARSASKPLKGPFTAAQLVDMLDGGKR